MISSTIAAALTSMSGFAVPMSWSASRNCRWAASPRSCVHRSHSPATALASFSGVFNALINSFSRASLRRFVELNVLALPTVSSPPVPTAASDENSDSVSVE
eukprot:CAMPEP_0119519508 /NCGR_PEP_ID=MMETSP1344-20130328/35791_1 /TAXON_ID=236787 /ORGANISM="Florenciella parvula, Strain CCMP2471" /LENGTH=101 /DNA_ID=CAMNT_0007557293 /DNA_START=364 /DNA_END=669 /DNA_ORIENTATION=+